MNLTDGMLSQLTNTNKEIYDNIRMGEVRERWVKTTDGKQMLTWVILPPRFRFDQNLSCAAFTARAVRRVW